MATDPRAMSSSYQELKERWPLLCDRDRLFAFQIIAGFKEAWHCTMGGSVFTYGMDTRTQWLNGTLNIDVERQHWDRRLWGSYDPPASVCNEVQPSLPIHPLSVPSLPNMTQRNMARNRRFLLDLRRLQPSTHGEQ